MQNNSLKFIIDNACCRLHNNSIFNVDSRVTGTGTPSNNVNDYVIAHEYSVSNEDCTSGSDGNKYFMLDDKKISKFATSLPDAHNGKVELYLLYTNGYDIGINNLNIKSGCKLIIINNAITPSKIMCKSSIPPSYYKGKTAGPAFDVGSSFG